MNQRKYRENEMFIDATKAVKMVCVERQSLRDSRCFFFKKKLVHRKKFEQDSIDWFIKCRNVHKNAEE